jgi:hypothetical protein
MNPRPPFDVGYAADCGATTDIAGVLRWRQERTRAKARHARNAKRARKAFPR